MRRGSSLAVLLTAGCAIPAAAHAQVLGERGTTSVFGPDGLKVLAAPSDAEIVAAAPAGKPPQGSAVIHCKAQPSGALADCGVTLERGAGFGQALLALAPRYRVEIPKGSPDGDEVVVTASWPPAHTPADWQVQPKPGDFAITYTDAAWKSGQPGYAAMNCQQSKLGELRRCVVVYQRPAGKGFGTMMLMFQAYLRLKPARLGGQPIASAVNVDFRFPAHVPGVSGKLP